MVKVSLSQRQDSILHFLVKEYIYTGRAVSSSSLVKKYNLEVSPATIRNDFQKLTQRGYLYKIHTSSGRVPTDKAWRFFVDRIFQERMVSHQKNKLASGWLREHRRVFQKGQRLIPLVEELLDILSNENHSFYFCYLFKKDTLVQEGLKYMFQEMAEERLLSLNFIQSVIDSLDNLDEKLKNLKITRIPSVFIGRENPFVKSDQFSSLVTPLHSCSAVLGTLAPKRMPYRKNILLLKTISDIFS